jgi:DNA processing protein
MAKSRQSDVRVPGRSPRYTAPDEVHSILLHDLIAFTGRPVDAKQESLFDKAGDADLTVFWSGDLSLLKAKCVCVIGARDVSEAGALRARRVARELTESGVVVTSGLAKGVDVAAHKGAIDARGSTIAVIGTPIDKAYPAEHSEVQMDIYRDHLLISQFRPGQRTFPSDFPKRNKLMAALTDASIIVEASDTSGTLHQAAECVRLGRWLFIMRSVAENRDLEWPAKFLNSPRVAVLSSVQEVLDAIG